MRILIDPTLPTLILHAKSTIAYSLVTSEPVSEAIPETLGSPHLGFHCPQGDCPNYAQTCGLI